MNETRRQQQAVAYDRETRRRNAEYDREVARMRLRVKISEAPEGGLFEVTGWVAEANVRRLRFARDVGDQELLRMLGVALHAERELQAFLAARRDAYAAAV